MFKRKKKKNNAGKIRRARVKNFRKVQEKQARANKRPTAKRKKQTKKINWKKVGVIFLASCFVFFTAWVLFLSTAVQIKEVKIIGYNEKREEILQSVREAERDELFNKKVNSNLALFPSGKLIDNIQEQYSVIKEVSVQKAFPNKLIVNITKRKQVFLWKQEKKCHLLDEDGGSVEEFECGDNEKELLNICRNKKEALGLDCQIFMTMGEWKDDINKEVVKEIIRAEQQILKEIRTTFYFDDTLVTIIPDPASKEIRIKTNSHGEVWFSTDKNLKKQLEKFRTFLEKKVNASDLENMLYIDLRLDNKIIYRFKEGYDNKEF